MISNNPFLYRSFPTSGKKCFNRERTVLSGSSEPGNDINVAKDEGPEVSTESLVNFDDILMIGASETIREPLEMNLLAMSPLPFPGTSRTRNTGTGSGSILVQSRALMP